jgi:type II restriction/modification system DNA methylase subunit YeeA
MGDTKGGAFDITGTFALEYLRNPTPHGLPNSDVVLPWINGLDVTRRSREMWIIDFGVDTSRESASRYEAPFEHIREHVLPGRQKNKRDAYRKKWWLHVEARSGMRAKLAGLSCFIVTPTVSKHRLFVQVETPTLPDHQLIVFAGDNVFFFGVLHSRIHETWARAMGTQVRERESGFRYTPTTCFETFPFPEPTEAQCDAISEAAKQLDELRNNWLNPPAWTRTEVLEFPGSADGPWKRYIDPATVNERGIGTVRYPRLVPKDVECAKELKKRTLTNLYNQRPTWLDLAHRRLDEAVFAAYGWPVDLPADELLARLLELNLARAAQA